jgi:hypothetical protein
MQINKTRFKPLTKQEKQCRCTNIFICIMENQIMLIVSVQRSMDHMQHVPTKNPKP